MKSKKLFSIIVPIYNAEQYLSKCLNSILTQPYQDEIEVVLINDGSTDNSQKIMNGYKDKFQNCILISRENKGVLFTKVEGVAAANGKYIMFLDSDDYLANNTIEIYKTYLKEFDYDIIRGNISIIFEENIDKNLDFDTEDIIYQSDIIEKYYKNLLTSNKFNSLCGQIIKKEIIDFSSIDTSIAMGDDIEFNLACYRNAKQIKIITNSLYYYRKNTGSITKTYSIERLHNNIIDIGKVYDTILNIVKDYNNDELTKLAYSSYLKIVNYFLYMLIDHYSDNKKIRQIVDSVMNNNKTSEARKKLKYKDIPFKKTRFLLYLLLNKKSKTYIRILKILSKVGIKYNH